MDTEPPLGGSLAKHFAVASLYLSLGVFALTAGFHFKKNLSF
jgi:hypothetical protein